MSIFRPTACRCVRRLNWCAANWRPASARRKSTQSCSPEISGRCRTSGAERRLTTPLTLVISAIDIFRHRRRADNDMARAVIARRNGGNRAARQYRIHIRRGIVRQRSPPGQICGNLPIDKSKSLRTFGKRSRGWYPLSNAPGAAAARPGVRLKKKLLTACRRPSSSIHRTPPPSTSGAGVRAQRVGQAYIGCPAGSSAMSIFRRSSSEITLRSASQ